jgi:hypothetical protein
LFSNEEEREARRKEERVLYDHNDWKEYRSRRGDLTQDVSLTLFGCLVAFLWIAVILDW